MHFEHHGIARPQRKYSGLWQPRVDQVSVEVFRGTLGMEEKVEAFEMLFGRKQFEVRNEAQAIMGSE